MFKTFMFLLIALFLPMNSFCEESIFFYSGDQSNQTEITSIKESDAPVAGFMANLLCRVGDDAELFFCEDLLRNGMFTGQTQPKKKQSINLFAQVTTAADLDPARLREFGERFKFALMSFPFSQEVNLLREKNPSLPVYIFSNPYFGFGDKFWGTPEVREQAIQDYALRLANGDIIYYNNEAVMNIGNPQWQDYFAAQARKHTDLAGATGIFLDTTSNDLPNFATGPGFEVPGNYVDAATWAGYNLTFTNKVVEAMGSKKVGSNSGSRGPGQAGPIPDADIRALTAFTSVEAFGLDLPFDTSAAESSWYFFETVFADMVLLSQTKPVIMEVVGTTDDEQLRLYALCAFLLIQNDNTFFYYTTPQDQLGAVSWFPEWGAQIGNPVGGFLYDDETGILSREFENGLVLVNVIDATIEAQHDGNYINWDGTPVTFPISLPAFTGKLLLKN